MTPILKHMLQDQNFNSVFEIGVASGGQLKDLPDSVDKGGIDTDEKDLAIIKKLFPNDADNFILHDAWDKPWPIASKKYDIAFAIGFFSLIDKDPIPVIKEMFRISKKIILAENHNEQESAVVLPVKGFTHVARDWKKIISELGICATFGKYSDEKTIIWQMKQSG